MRCDSLHERSSLLTGKCVNIKLNEPSGVRNRALGSTGALVLFRIKTTTLSQKSPETLISPKSYVKL
jgi:hypothetical protein